MFLLGLSCPTKISWRSSSSWALLCLSKSDNMPRLCTDSYSYPLPCIEDCIDQVGVEKFISKFDFLNRCFRKSCHWSGLYSVLACTWIQYFLWFFTDHNPLTFLSSLQFPNQTLVRWAFHQSYTKIRHMLHCLPVWWYLCHLHSKAPACFCVKLTTICKILQQEF